MPEKSSSWGARKKMALHSLHTTRTREGMFSAMSLATRSAAVPPQHPVGVGMTRFTFGYRLSALAIRTSNPGMLTALVVAMTMGVMATLIAASAASTASFGTHSVTILWRSLRTSPCAMPAMDIL